MRRGEIFNLKWDNIDFDFNFIELTETKSGKSRKIPISNKLMEIFKKRNNSQYVFINKDTGEPFKDIKKAFRNILKQAQIKNFRFHDLRHTAATRMVEKGIPLPVVQELLGHAKISTTMRYTHAMPEQKQLAIAVLNDKAFVEKSAKLNAEGYRQFTQVFDEMKLEYVPSYGNFVLVRVGEDDAAGARVNLALLKKGIIVRPVGGYGLPKWLRITIGLPEENEAAIRALKEILAEK